MEIWKDIKDYPDYMVSNQGNVKSLKFGKERMLSTTKNTKGYLIISLSKDGKKYNKLIHRLVAEAFIPNIDNKPCIDHINTDRTDNRIENLRWCTQEENCNNLLSKENYSKNNFNIGKFSKNNHLSKEIIQFSLDGEFVKIWDCAKDINRELGINCGNISSCCNGRKAKAGGFIWGFEKDYEKIPFKVFDLTIYNKKSFPN